VLFGLLCLIWGTTWLALKIGATAVPPGLFSGLRWTVAGGLLLGWQAARGGPVRVRAWSLMRLAAVALLMISLNALLILYGLRHVGSGLASVISAALTPISLLGFAAAMRQERVTRRQIGAITLGVCGILVLFGPQAASGQGDPSELAGVAGLILGCLCYTFGSVLIRPLMRLMPAAQVAGATNLIGGIALLVWSVPFEPGAVEALSLRWGAPAWAAWWFLLLVGSLGATMIYLLLVRDWGASRTGTYAFVSPVISVALGVLFDDERLDVTDGLGMILMLAAAVLVLRPTKAA
jgi:drug/metabolite transporter (DMT)-like permease